MKSLLLFQTGIERIYELENVLQIFVSGSKLHSAEDDVSFDGLKNQFDIALKLIGTNTNIQFEIVDLGVLVKRTLFVFSGNSKEDKVEFKRILYMLLSDYYTPLSKWGILVGIRPVKIVHELLDEGIPEDALLKILTTKYLVNEEKASLMMEIAKRERPHITPYDPDLISLYVCIPFCPTRCLYCSFPSNDLKQKGKKVPEYLQKLEEEIRVATAHIYSIGKKIDCIYIGGGTPTSIRAVELKSLLTVISENVKMEDLKEYTVEAGRPDTIDNEKLNIMKQYGVDRICINPQTMNEETLVTIGRSHNSQSIIEVMEIARNVGFKTINMDLIMGLPGESAVHSQKTVARIMALDPENITIHTLAVKRASRLNEDRERYELAHDEIVSEMMALADQHLRNCGLTPYYMYRQKKMIGHLENVGYAKAGHESLYNMRIMEEKHSIVACGAGAVSKLCEPKENRFERVANFKGLEDYLDRFDEILAKKKLLI